MKKIIVNFKKSEFFSNFRITGAHERKQVNSDYIGVFGSYAFFLKTRISPMSNNSQTNVRKGMKICIQTF